MQSGPPFKADKAFLQDHALFGGFSDDDLAVIMPMLVEETFKAGDDIVVEGQMGDRLYFIESGSVDVIKCLDDQCTTIAKLKAGDAFGEMELIDIQARSATVRARESVVALTLRNKDMLRLYKDNLDVFARLLLNLAREVSRRLRTMDNRAAH